MKLKQINWREKALAAAIHFGVTLLVAGISASIIFFVWYPGTLATMVGGTKLFKLVVASDLVLGPAMSLVIYSSLKSRRELVVDYILIGTVQLAALVYGVSIVASSRPIYIAFAKDRLEIVTAIEMDDADLAAAPMPYRGKPWFGPQLVSIQYPSNPDESYNLIVSALGGKGAPLMPKYYRPYDAAHEAIVAKSRSLDELLKGSGKNAAAIEAAIAATGKSKQQLRWLLVRDRFGFGIALLDTQNYRPIRFLKIDPVWLDQSTQVKKESVNRK